MRDQLSRYIDERIEALGAERAELEERIARRFHEVYEEFAPNYGYETRPESAVPWDEVPAANKALMIFVVQHLIAERTILPGFGRR